MEKQHIQHNRPDIIIVDVVIPTTNNSKSNYVGNVDNYKILTIIIIRNTLKTGLLQLRLFEKLHTVIKRIVVLDICHITRKFANHH